MNSCKFLGRRSSGILVGLVLLLFLLPSASAISVSILEPLNITYPYSANLPLLYTPSADATLCYFTTNGGIINTTINNCVNSSFDVDFDDSYTLILYAENASDIANDSIVFSVQRGFTSEMGGVAAGIIIAIASLVLFCGAISKALGDKFESLKYFFFGLALLFIIVTINVAYTTSREYLKVPAFESLLMTLFFIISWILFILLVYFIIYIFLYKKFLKKMENLNESGDTP